MPSTPKNTLLQSFRQSLQAFASSPSTLQVLRTIPSTAPSRIPRRIYILDSSFNPPTRAHLRIAASALNDIDPSHFPARLLLLLAIQNADKAPKPASFEQRLAMMTIFAEDLLKTLPAEAKRDDAIAVDIGVTKLPYFMDKSAAIISSGIYQPDPKTHEEEPVEQVHLVGFDTLIRIFNPKYYPPTHTLDPLEPLFRHHRLRVTYRDDQELGDKQEQDRYLQDIRDGKREDEGGKREWADKIEMVEGHGKGEEAISSTKIREAVAKRDVDGVKRLCTEGVANWIQEERLYTEQD